MHKVEVNENAPMVVISNAAWHTKRCGSKHNSGTNRKTQRLVLASQNLDHAIRKAVARQRRFLAVAIA